MSVTATDPTIDVLVETSIVQALALMQRADGARPRRERSNRRRFSRLLADPRALEVTVTLTDEVMRIKSLRSSVNVFRHAARRASIEGFGPLNALGLQALAGLTRVAPASVIRLVHRRIRRLSSDMILPAAPKALRHHIERRRHDGLAINVNVLGEAVLGEREAQDRLRRVIEMIRRPDVDYVSVKLSSIVSQIVTVDRDGSSRRVGDAMRLLFGEAGAHDTFVNLDMEEYRDLDLTVGAFRAVLSEARFAAVHAGIVLQAYLPESHQVFDDLVAWSMRRHDESGGTIKVRLVKGANLAMESAEAQLHGWPRAPYRSKSDVDASYARLIDVALRPEHAQAVRIGIASHNLFHLTWALEVARHRGVLEQLDVEMLEGMANTESLVIAGTGQRVVLYAPVTTDDDFASAVAYLARRLDENTSDENYLKAAFDISSDPETFSEQRERFVRSVRERHHVSMASLRHRTNTTTGATDFANAVDSDTTSSTVVAAIAEAMDEIRGLEFERLALVIDGNEVVTAEFEVGRDPAAPTTPWYEYAVAGPNEIDDAIAVARSAQVGWSNRTPEDRRRILFDAADVMERQRPLTIAMMARDAGKTVAEADPEVSEAIDFARFYATCALDLEGSSPLGVVVVVPPWNFPYAIAAGGVLGALAAASTVILKPAPETVATARLLARQLWEGGVPKDALQLVMTRDDENGRRLVTHEGVDAVILTGSFDTALAFTHWRPDINLLAETSGKNAMLLSACADIDAAVKDLVHSAFAHAGQKCSAASLAIVVAELYDDPSFLRQLHDAVTSLVVGPGWDLSTVVGPLIGPPSSSLKRALSRLDDGESWLVEPHPLDSAGQSWSPGVKVGVRPGSWSHLHEWFGPVLGVMVAPDFDTAIEWQNMTDFGLTAGVHSLDEDECEQWLHRVQAGNLYVNRAITGAVVNRQPFGGWRRSSVGPTAKAGGTNYVASLRRWPTLEDPESAMTEAKDWWDHVGARAIDRTGLSVERNIERYRRFAKQLVLRVDGHFRANELALVRFIASEANVAVSFSSASPVVSVPEGVVESIDQLVERWDTISRVRWLSHEVAPVAELLEHGITVDRRALAQHGGVEMARWLVEQSVAIVNHRYGNVNAGPKPLCGGLG